MTLTRLCRIHAFVYLLLFPIAFCSYQDESVKVARFQPAALRPSYDYIVVGGGSTGAVIASRLSEDPSVTVLLLEAGGDTPFYTEIPGALGFALNSNLDWNYK
jgi:hypothetical protein